MKHFFLKMAGICIFIMSVSFCSAYESMTQSPYSGIETQYIPDEEQNQNEDDFIIYTSSANNDIDNKEPQEILQALEFVSGNIIYRTEINFVFTKSVKADSISIEPYQEIDKIDEGSIIKIHFKDDIKTNTDFVINLCVTDNIGNKLNVQFPFNIDNWNAQLVINEVRTEYSGSAKRAEFIEFKVIKTGSLGGIKVYCESNSKVPMIYEFQAVDVRLDEYVVLHTRTIDDLCLDELNDNLDESGGKDSCSSARDFWIPGNTKLVRKNEVVYILDTNDNVIDAVMLTDGENGWNKKIYLYKAAEFLLEQKAWHFIEGQVNGAADAIDCSSIKTAATKSISRDESGVNTRSIDDWYITVSSGATPGMPNSKKP